ncbi:protein SOGA3a isoform X2 [Anguilla rostrata]|uniref:protein SOGA3a isoform X2 n=1 Tax=Anguilla rostrata TaxID=7938 RepID=UPI0030CCEA67
MWNAFGNGSGLQGSGRYVSKAQGWEFVPCSTRFENERGRGKSRSPIRTLSSPASIGPFYEQPLPGLGVTSEAGARQQATLHELQTQNTRLKKKFEDLKKRHVQDKDEWMREKELLLRQVADIQGGENRRILLDLKSVLEDVQLEVKKEETKRNDLQLQYTKDRCAWDLERAELKCRIAQLEARGSKVVVEALVTPDPRETLQKEREEQKRLLADTHTAAMDLRCRLEHSERGWVREKSELLERFDAERKEWESQLRDMQRKIEELYDEVKTRREGVVIGLDAGMQDGGLRLSLQSTSTASSILTDPPDLHSSSNGSSNQPNHLSNGENDHHGSHYSEPLDQESQGYGAAADRCGVISQDPGMAELELILQGCLKQGFEKTPLPSGQQGMTELEHILQRCLEHGFESSPSPAVHQAYVSSPSNFFSSNDRKRNTTELNAALREIARVSEELCSYQDEIRKKAEDNWSGMESLSFLEEFEAVQNVKNIAGNVDPLFDLSQWCNQFQVPEERNWVNWESTNQDPNKAEQTEPPIRKRQAPPIPPRTTSWYLSSPSAPKLEFPVPESFTDKKCHSPSVVTDKKYPSVLKKFGEMLQENEGYTLTNSGVVATPVPMDSKCNIGCCHSSWSCNGSRFGSSKSSTYVPVQKCQSDANVQEAETDCKPESMQSDNPKCPGGQFQPVDNDIDTLDFRVPSSGVQPPYPNAKGPRRNATLEQKTAEFNRTLFQVEMGHGVEDSITPAEVPVSGRGRCSPQHSEIKLRDVTSDLPPQYPDFTPEVKTSDLSSEYPEIKPKVTTSDLPLQNLKDKKLEAPAVESNLSAFTQYVPSMVRAKSPGVRTGTAVWQTDKVRSGSSTRGRSNIGSWVLKDQPWKPTTLAAYPRPADSRSNYGAVEKILKSYESSDGVQCFMQCRPSPTQEDDLIELLDNLEVKQRLSSRETTSTRPGLRRETVSTMQERESSIKLFLPRRAENPMCL